MKIFLLNAPPLRQIGVVGQIYPPLGILYLSAFVKKKNPQLKIKALDGYHHGESKILEEIKNFEPDILGVSFTTQAARGAYKIINGIKKILPEILVVCGGPHPTVLPEEVLRVSNSDIVVLGEGEETFFEVVRNYLDKNKVKLYDIEGTVVKNGMEIKRNPLRPIIKNLDDIPFPDRSLLNIMKYPGYH